jgi:hypothetical protein
MAPAYQKGRPETATPRGESHPMGLHFDGMDGLVPTVTVKKMILIYIKGLAERIT